MIEAARSIIESKTPRRWITLIKTSIRPFTCSRFCAFWPRPKSDAAPFARLSESVPRGRGRGQLPLVSGALQSRFYKLARRYLATLRTLTGRYLDRQYWPWLRRRDKVYLGALLDRGPHMYWIRDEEAAELFENAGFEILGIGSDVQVTQGASAPSVAELGQLPVNGRLYLACRKPVS